MTACRAPRRYFADEEPDTEFIGWLAYTNATDCSFCGHNGHVLADCPNRPQGTEQTPRRADRTCDVCGAPSGTDRWCSTGCHRADEPGAYGDGEDDV